MGLVASLALLIFAGVRVVSNGPDRANELALQTEEGEPLDLTDFRGRAVLINIWATWCIPCRTEMPSLDRLQARLGSPDFEVVAISIDRGGREVVRPFFDETGIEYLTVYLDPAVASLAALSVLGVPTSVYLDENGREIFRVVGPAEWDSPEMIRAIIDRRLP